ncbi:MAG: hypothetical protein ACRDHN_07230, partial [Thermomicrobiales bacterium]
AGVGVTVGATVAVLAGVGVESGVGTGVTVSVATGVGTATVGWITCVVVTVGLGAVTSMLTGAVADSCSAQAFGTSKNSHIPTSIVMNGLRFRTTASASRYLLRS